MYRGRRLPRTFGLSAGSVQLLRTLSPYFMYTELSDVIKINSPAVVWTPNS